MEELNRKLPFILSAVMALLAGIVGLANNKNMDFIYKSMFICIFAFGFIGFFIRSFIQSIIKEKGEAQKAESKEELTVDNDLKGSVIDLKVDDSSTSDFDDLYGDGFAPLEVSKVIRTSINKDDN